MKLSKELEKSIDIGITKLSKKYTKAKMFREKMIFDVDYQTSFIDECIKLGAIVNIDKEDERFCNRWSGLYTKEFCYYVWENVHLRIVGMTKNEYETYELLSKEDWTKK